MMHVSIIYGEHSVWHDCNVWQRSVVTRTPRVIAMCARSIVITASCVSVVCMRVGVYGCMLVTGPSHSQSWSKRQNVRINVAN